MPSIDRGRVIAGGLLAGLMINAGEYVAHYVVFTHEFQALYGSLNLVRPAGVVRIAFALLGFAGGIVLAWLYAVMRPRLGPGAGTAALAGMAAWVFAYVWPVAGFWAMGVFSAGFALMLVLWGLVELTLATMAAGWIYREAA